MTLKDKTLFISGAGRGVGLALALHTALEGTNVALIAKTAGPHPKLDGTVYVTPGQFEAAGGRALPIIGDIRDESQVVEAVTATVNRFGGIDVCVNNAPAIDLSGTETLATKHCDLAGRSTPAAFVVSRARIPHRQRSVRNPVSADQPRAALDRPAYRRHDRQAHDEPSRPHLRDDVSRRLDHVQGSLAADADRDRCRSGLLGADVPAQDGVIDRHAVTRGAEPRANLFLGHV